MTSGQRIAQKRKELGLSQEGLGEQLGISRQAIYKWESDASLPEIDKLITLSKLFSVSVGWLLGVEEKQEDAPPQASGELTETQLQMVQEIVDRYLAAQPVPPPPKHRGLVRFCGVAAVLCLIVALFNLFSKLDRVTQNYDSLRWSVDNVNDNVNHQINSITRRVEDILKSQNNLTADWSAEVASTDLRTNTVTFDIRVVPRTYVEGMTALFQAHSGEDTMEVPIEPGEDRAFAGQVTCPLSDNISLTVVLVTGGKRETQWLEDYNYLYSDTFPSLWLDSRIWFEGKDGVLPAQLPVDQSRGDFVRVGNEDNANHYLGWNPDPPATIRVGLFKDRKLVMWYQGGIESTNWNGEPTDEYVWRRPEAVTLEPGGTYCEAAVYTDEYGRQQVYDVGNCFITYLEGEGWGVGPSYESSHDPASWEF